MKRFKLPLIALMIVIINCSTFSISGLSSSTKFDFIPEDTLKTNSVEYAAASLVFILNAGKGKVKMTSFEIKNDTVNDTWTYSTIPNANREVSIWIDSKDAKIGNSFESDKYIYSGNNIEEIIASIEKNRTKNCTFKLYQEKAKIDKQKKFYLFMKKEQTN